MNRGQKAKYWLVGGIIFLIIELFANRQVSNDYIDFDKSCTGPSCTSHQEDMPCQSFTDCFNCSLAMCAWSETNTCVEDSSRGWQFYFEGDAMGFMSASRDSWQYVSQWYDFG